MLSAEGTASTAANDLRLEVGDLPANQFGYFLMSRDVDFVPLPVPSQGVLCLGLPFVRFDQQPLNSGPNGEIVFPIDQSHLPGGAQIQVGESWAFQYWFRDLHPGATSNTSSAVAVRFCP